uniref:Uncharacterized protein n=1 Tax=Ditylum brightwellii TaxID=49249 RepID=A0A7S4W9K2_9STRA|mmetsp:Transcript_690/g.863  ORF Transcript_690/g.863 Transcript_690/m.863 type:complete len:287 (-) Transcript_690:429-1289(-)
MSERKGKQNATTPSTKHDAYRVIGDSMNYIGIACNLLLTSAAMTKWPNAALYDEWFNQNGYCVNFDPQRRIDTSITASLVLIISAVGTYFFKEAKKSTMNPVLRKRVESSIFANFAHGFGHLFLYYLGGPPPPVNFSLTMEGLGWALTLFAFWFGTLNTLMSSASSKIAIILAVTAIGLQEFLGVPPELSFTYSQTFILLSIAVDQLIQPLERKGFTYMVMAFSYVPLLVLFVLEGTTCSNFLAHIGGHALYDSYLSLMPFALYYIVRHHEKTIESTSKDPKVKMV